MGLENKKVALVHDWLTNMGGAERNNLEHFIDLFPDAPIYTSMADNTALSPKIKQADIRTSFLQKKMKPGKANHQKSFPFMPMAFENFDLNEYEVILSLSSCCAKGVVTAPDALHICYCNSPMRYAWEFYYEYIEDMSSLKKRLVKYLIHYMRIWDAVSANRVDYFIANSENVAKRIRKHYRRDVTVIHPPANLDLYKPGETDGDFFLCVSRLVKYKRIDLAIEAFNELGLPLIIIGDGGEREKLQKMAKGNITFLGAQPDSVLVEHYQKCKAFIFPGEEDFGITPVEAQSCGRPVIAFGKGGALETVVDGKTGIFFGEQTPQCLVDAVERFQELSFDKAACVENAQRFKTSEFKRKIHDFITKKLEEKKS